ncbi:MAG TPA: hypothetical protein DCS11_00230 [Syntrophus sp. (in: bacteria)]|jgi:O-antigen/teichoic acid export membrane protein|nr:hypothetical protein [Syntrophus sp. (in: bacteria)]
MTLSGPAGGVPPRGEDGSLRRILRDLLRPTDLKKAVSAYLGGNLVSTASRAISGLLVARLAGPGYMGLFLGLSVAIPYARLLHLGVQNGTGRELPMLLGAGRREEALGVLSATWWWVTRTSALLVLAFAAAGAALGLAGRGDTAVAFAAYAVIIPLTFMNETLEITYRTANDFIRLSRIRILDAVFALASVALLLLHPWWGLLGRAILLLLLHHTLLRLWCSLPVRGRWDRPHFLQVVKIGLPMFAVGYLLGIFNVLDRTLILKFLGTDALGLYTPALMVSMAVLVLPTSIAQVFYPRMCLEYGRTGSGRPLLRLALVPQGLLAVGLLPLFAAGWFLMDPFVRWMLPQYVGGIPAAQWMLVFIYFQCLTIPHLLFNVFHRMAALAILTVSSLAVGGGASWLFLGLGLGLQGVPMGCALGALWYSLAGTAWTTHMALKSPAGPAL